MSWVSNIAKSAVRGGVVKSIGKGVVKGLKRGAGKIVKGVKSTMPKIVRGVKSGTAQITELPTAVKEAFELTAKLPQGFGAGNTMRVAINKISQNLAKASKGVLSKDSAERLSAKLAEALTNKQQTKVLRNILKNARANETWGNYLARGAKVGESWIRGAVRGTAENVVIDKSIILAGQGLAAVATTGAGVATGVVIAKSK